MVLPFQAETSQGALGTLANVVTSLANLSESLNNGDTSEVQQEEQSASEITRYASIFDFVEQFAFCMMDSCIIQ